MEKNNFSEAEKEYLKIKDVEMPAYTKKGILIEHQKYNKRFWLYMLMRCVSFLIDFLIPGTLQFIVWSVIKQGIIVAGITTLIYYQMYYFISMMILNGRTIGMVAVRHRVVHKTGFVTTTLNLYTRAFVMSVYALPFIGWGLLVLNLISALFMRGITLFDLISMTIVVTERQYREIKYIEKLENEEG